MIRFEVVERCVIGEDLVLEVSSKAHPAISNSALLNSMMGYKKRCFNSKEKLCRTLAEQCTSSKRDGVCFLSNILRCPFQSTSCSNIRPEDWEIYFNGVCDGNELGLQNKYGIASPVKEWDTQTPYETNKE